APAHRIVTEPLAQGRRGREIPRPLVDRRLLLRDAARPNAVHQHAIAVRAGGRLVDTLQLYCRHRQSGGAAFSVPTMLADARRYGCCGIYLPTLPHLHMDRMLRHVLSADRRTSS